MNESIICYLARKGNIVIAMEEESACYIDEKNDVRPARSSY